MGIITFILMFLGFISAKYACDAVFYLIGFFPKDKRSGRWISLDDTISGSDSFKIDIVILIIIFAITNIIITTLKESGRESLNIDILTYYMSMTIYSIARFIQAIKAKMYKNRQYNKICDLIDKVDILIDGLEVAMESLKSESYRSCYRHLSCDYSSGDKRYRRLDDLYDTLIEIRKELVYIQSTSSLYVLVNIADEMNNSNKSENINILIKEIDKINAYNELSSSRLNSLYSELRNKAIENSN